MTRIDLYTSVTRIAQLDDRDHGITPVPRDEWRRGDYVVGTVTRRPDPDMHLEDPVGRPAEVVEGGTIVGALGSRRATRELVGDWQAIGDDGHMEAITRGGVLGWVTSRSPFTSPPVQLRYEGHVTLDGEPTRMDDHRVTPDPEPAAGREPAPVVLVIGTSMSSGKTMTAQVLSRLLVEDGHDVVGVKLAGAGRSRDALSLADAGADPAFDFVDAGLPSTVVPEGTFEDRMEDLVAYVDEQDPDVVVAEVGASPLEPYNGAAAVRLVEDRVVFTALCATDPYAVVGLEEAFGRTPDLVSGIAANTEAGVDLVEDLTGYRALNLQRPRAEGPARRLLRKALS